MGRRHGTDGGSRELPVPSRPLPAWLAGEWLDILVLAALPAAQLALEAGGADTPRADLALALAGVVAFYRIAERSVHRESGFSVAALLLCPLFTLAATPHLIRLVRWLR